MRGRLYLSLAVLIFLFGVVLIARTLIREKNTHQTGSTMANFATITVTPKPTEKNTSKTEIVYYKQTYIPKQSQAGSCWTESIATSNPTAWRCMDDKEKGAIGFIYDPCFETDSGQVVCGVDPEKTGSGFELKLTKALPKESRIVDMRGDTPWIVKLEDSTYCYTMTGTAAFANNEFAYYYCNQTKYLLSGKDGNSTFNKTGEYWQVRVVTMPNGEKMDKEFPVQNINVIKVWE